MGCRSSVLSAAALFATIAGVLPGKLDPPPRFAAQNTWDADYDPGCRMIQVDLRVINATDRRLPAPLIADLEVAVAATLQHDLSSRYPGRPALHPSRENVTVLSQISTNGLIVVKIGVCAESASGGAVWSDARLLRIHCALKALVQAGLPAALGTSPVWRAASPNAALRIGREEYCPLCSW